MAQSPQKLMQFKVTSPSGDSFIVTAPEGSSQEHILNYVELNAQKQKNDALRSDLQGESWISRNLKGALTAPSNLLQGTKQLAHELMNPQQYVNPKTGETSSFPIENYQAQPRKQYDTSQIKQNRVIAEEAPVGAIAGNLATAVPLAFIPGANRTAGSMAVGGILSALQPTLGQESRIENAGVGALTSGIVPNAPKILEAPLKSASNRLMMSAIKPAKAELTSGAGQKAAQTMLEEGVNPTINRTIFGRGLDTLELKIGALNDEISNIIQNSTQTISKQSVIGYLDDLIDKAKYSLAPKGDMAAVQAVKDEFIAHPLATLADIPVQLAQKLKQGTYKSIGTKNFNEIGGSTKEALRAGAKGLKEGIAQVEPVNLLNAKESELINALDVAESRAYTALKNNPAGLAGLANNPAQFVAMMADRSDAFKALMARMMYQTSKGLSKIPEVTNKGLVGLPASSAVTSYKQLNTDQNSLNTNELLGNALMSPKRPTDNTKKARKIGNILMQNAQQGEQQ
jgi:hypothetical protein